MKAKSSPATKPGSQDRGGGTLQRGTRQRPKGGPRKPRLRVPELKAGEGIANLLPEEEAFIREEIAQRTARGWSQAKVAELCGLDRSALQHYEHRRRAPTLRAAILICRAFGEKLEDYCRRAQRWLPSLQLGFGMLDLGALA